MKPAIDYRLIGHIGDVAVVEVEGNEVRQAGYIDFTEGGNAARYTFIPAKEIWVERRKLSQDKAATIVHEYVEMALMLEGLTYNQAHDIALLAERDFRNKYVPSSITRARIIPYATAFLSKLEHRR